MEKDPLIAESVVTCEGAPMQIEGRLTDGRFFYFRSRHRRVSLSLGKTLEDAYQGANEIVFEMVAGYEDDRHTVSYIDLDACFKLVGMLIRLHLNCEEYATRRSAEQTWLLGQ